MIAIIILVPALLGQQPVDASKARREILRELYVEDAASYVIHRDAGRKEKVELRREPAYLWTNPTRNSGQDGAVFVWTCRGRAEVVGSIFSSPQAGPRDVIHELHSLSTVALDVDRKVGKGWKPLKPGVEPKPVADAPRPASTPSGRMAQMRAILREFSAAATDAKGERWELRALPQPLYRYESTDPDVLDGAVFTLVSSAGTDPELMVILEARKAPGEPAGAMAWQFAGARFSDMALSVKHKDKVVYSVPVIAWEAVQNVSTDRYRLFNDREIPAVEGSAPAKEAKLKP